MHIPVIALVPAAPDSIAPASGVSAVRTSAGRNVIRRPGVEERAVRELGVYFARSFAHAPLSDENAAVEAILLSISAYHRGVLELFHDTRTWPGAIQKTLGEFTALAVRLDCVDHPATGSTAALEKIAGERLAAEGPEVLIELWVRAERHYQRALRAYTKALAATRSQGA
jgi:hypothetical protein